MFRGVEKAYFLSECVLIFLDFGFVWLNLFNFCTKKKKSRTLGTIISRTEIWIRESMNINRIRSQEKSTRSDKKSAFVTTIVHVTRVYAWLFLPLTTPTVCCRSFISTTRSADKKDSLHSCLDFLFTRLGSCLKTGRHSYFCNYKEN